MIPTCSLQPIVYRKDEAPVPIFIGINLTVYGCQTQAFDNCSGTDLHSWFGPEKHRVLPISPPFNPSGFCTHQAVSLSLDRHHYRVEASVSSPMRTPGQLLCACSLTASMDDVWGTCPYFGTHI